MVAFLRLPRHVVDMKSALKSVDFSGAFTLVCAVVCIMVPAVCLDITYAVALVYQIDRDWAVTLGDGLQFLLSPFS